MPLKIAGTSKTYGLRQKTNKAGETLSVQGFKLSRQNAVDLVNALTEIINATDDNTALIIDACTNPNKQGRNGPFISTYFEVRDFVEKSEHAGGGNGGGGKQKFVPKSQGYQKPAATPSVAAKTQMSRIKAEV